MGKRELLLAAVIVMIGVAVYHATAPPGDPSEDGFSLSRIVENVRREIRGRPASAEGTHNTRHAVAPAVRELRIAASSTGVTITGEDRADIEAALQVTSNGYDDAEAKALVDATRLVVDEAGELLMMKVDYPVEGRQTATLHLKVPSRLGVRLDDKSGALTVTDVATVGIGSARGETTIRNVRGAVTVGQRGSRITIGDVGSLRLTTFAGAEARVSNVRGEAVFNLQTGELQAEHLNGMVEVEARNTDVRFDKLDRLKGPVRINAVGGEVLLIGLATEARIDGRQTEIRIDLAAPATLGVYNEGDDAMEITLPRAGLRIDALAVNGRLSIDDALKTAGLEVSAPAPAEEGQSREERVTGAVFGGGPAITLRASRGDIVLRAR